MKVMDFANRWEEHRGIKRKPGIKHGYSAWERIKKFFASLPAPHMKAGPEAFFLKPKEKRVKETLGNIEEDSSVIYTKFGKSRDFSPQFAANKLKELGWSVEEIRKLGWRYEDIQ